MLRETTPNGRAAAILFAIAAPWACAGASPPASGDVPAAPPPALRAAPDALRQEAPAPPEEQRPPTSVALAPAEPAPPPAPRLTSQDYITWIRRAPRTTDSFIGYIRVGQSVALKSEALVKGQGCSGGFYAIEPRGYVCNDRTVTRAPTRIFAEESGATLPTSGPFPYRYALSNGAPMYNRIPTRDEQRRFEGRYGKAGTFLVLPKSQSAHEDLAEVRAIEPDGPIPWFLTEEAQRPRPLGLLNQTIPLGSMLSFTRSFEAEGRTWLLSAEETFVPADRTRPFRKSEFRGTRIGGDVALPLAWFRGSARPQYRRNATGTFERLTTSWPVRTWAGLTGVSAEGAGGPFLETTARDASGAALYAAASDAVVTRAEEKIPIGVRPGQKWVIVRITDGTLVAYEGLTPVFATLVSPGAGGVPVRGQDPVRASTTPTGTYYVTFKDRAATMSPEKGKDRSFWIADVPHTQYFNPPFALHAAYWHERFGEPTSAGCINLSPIDAEVVFDWSDPPVPEGWQGATGSGATKENGPTTAVVVRR